MCNLFEVSRSCFYAFLNAKPGIRYARNQSILKEIKLCYIKSHKIYGSPRIARCLQNQGIQVSEVTVAKLMQRNSIRSITSKKFKITTNSKHKEPISSNILNRNFSVDNPSEAWISDITYIRTQEGWLYLTTVIDLFDRKVIGCSISSKMDTENTVLVAFKDALNKRIMHSNTIFHSDRGVQYASKEFRKFLSKETTKQSMSRKGNCWDNAVAESFFSSFKKECVRKKIFYSKTNAYQEIMTYIHWYNNERIHSSLGYKTPLEFEIKYRLSNVA